MKPLPGQEKKPMQVVLDTNVLISALVFRKRLGKIGDLIEQGIITPCFVVSTWTEFENVMDYEKLRPHIAALRTTAEEIIESVRSESYLLADPLNIPDIVRDSGDNNILAAVGATKALCIVTGDAELLELKYYQDTPIVSPQEFLQKFK